MWLSAGSLASARIHPLIRSGFEQEERKDGRLEGSDPDPKSLRCALGRPRSSVRIRCRAYKPVCLLMVCCAALKLALTIRTAVRVAMDVLHSL